MRRGDTIELTLTGLAFGGDSLGRADDGRVVFLAGGAPGDRVRVRLDELKPRFARGTLLEVIAAGPARVTPRCPLVGSCGGCQWQEVSLDEQRAAKQAVVERALGRLGAAVAPIVAATGSFGYRSRARMTRGAHGALGFQARRSHDVVDVPACPLLEPALDRALQLARRHLGAALPEGASVAGLVGRGGRVHLAIAGAPRLPEEALAALAAEEGVAGVVSEAGLFGEPAIDVGGEPGDDLVEGASADQGAPFLAAADGFAQASHQGNRALRALVAAEAARLLDGVAAPRVLELHAGDGNFTRDLARRAAQVVAVEGDRHAIARLPGNVAAALAAGGGSQLGAAAGATVEAVASSVEEACRRLIAAGERFDLVVLDPPRAGAAEVAHLLAALAPRVLYVSCDPMTLARDAATLAGAGLACRGATPLDLMPHTGHVEVVCVLARPEPLPGM